MVAPADMEVANPSAAPAEDTAKTATAEPQQPQPITLTDIKRNVGLIVRATDTNQTRLTQRAIRNTTAVRTRVAPAVLIQAVEQYVPESHPARAGMLSLLAALPSPPAEAEQKAAEKESSSSAGAAADMDTSEDAAAAAAAAAEPAKEKWEDKLGAAAPEVETYVSLLVLTTALREGRKSEAVDLSSALLQRVVSYNRRTLDVLAAKVVFYYSLAYERAGRIAETRSPLLALHRTCCLRHDEMGQATVLNLLLRNLLAQNLLDQAYKLASKTNFPEGCSNNQFCRYLYYMGRIGALQLDYSDAHTKLLQSSRKAPQNTALAFRVACQKLMIIVQLLLGEVPERGVFNQSGFRAPLQPYLQLTQAVRLGDLIEFNQAVEQNKAIFQADKTYTLIQRLAHNVIKTGLRKVNVSYSRISLQDLCTKVRLDSPESAEFVCAKAIRDGVIDATIDHAGKCVRSREAGDAYASAEPQAAFHKRITFCLDVHNEAVRAMRYPANAYKRDLEKAQRKGAAAKSEEEIAKEIEDEMDDEEGL